MQAAGGDSMNTSAPKTAVVASNEKAEPSRRTRKKAQTRRRIYEAAMALFETQGYAGTSIVQICKAADIGHGTFFNHFPTKSALLYEFNTRFAEEALGTLTEPRSSASEELTFLVERMSKELKSRAEVMRAMLAEFYDTPTSLAISTKADRALRQLVTSIIARGQDRGELSRDVDARLAAASFLVTAGAIVGGQVFRPGEVSSREVKRQFLQLVLHGLAPEHSEKAPSASIELSSDDPAKPE